MTNKWIKEDIMKLVELRKSVRTFEERPLSEEDRKEIRDFLECSENPFHVKVEFRFLESLEKSTSLGTYGVIKGATSYLGAMVKEGPMALEALGYEMENLMLFLVSKKIGTCWLGGTFKREDFKEAMVVPEGYLFPAITPVGYEKVEKSLTDRLVRFIAKGNQRKAFEELFFQSSFQESYPREEDDLLSDLLEMVRLGPSASNKQPWRILVEDHGVHFYEKKTPDTVTLFHMISRGWTLVSPLAISTWELWNEISKESSSQWGLARKTCQKKCCTVFPIFSNNALRFSFQLFITG